jgi:anti-sigma factor RsiW
MKPETLEVLLLDRVMGELPPEVAELLETHLAHHPEVARQAEELASAYRLARQAVAGVAEVPRQPLAVERLQRAQVAQRRWSMAWGLARLAACVAFGLALGWYGHTLREAPRVAAAAPAVVRAAPATAAERPGAKENAPDFWSLSSLEAARRERQPGESRTTGRYRLQWDSPVKMPRVEEDL